MSGLPQEKQFNSGGAAPSSAASSATSPLGGGGSGAPPGLSEAQVQALLGKLKRAAARVEREVVSDASLEAMRAPIMAQLAREGLIRPPVAPQGVPAPSLWQSVIEWWNRPLLGLPTPAWGMAALALVVAAAAWLYSDAPRLTEGRPAPLALAPAAAPLPVAPAALPVQFVLRRGAVVADAEVESGRPGTITTGADGYAAFAAGGRARVVALPKARLEVVRSDAEASRFRLVQGMALFEAKLNESERARPDSYTVATAQAEIRVTGTRFIVQATDKGTRVTVESGTVWMRAATAGAQEFRVGAGEWAILTAQAEGTPAAQAVAQNDPHGLLLKRLAAQDPFAAEQPGVAMAAFIEDPAPVAARAKPEAVPRAPGVKPDRGEARKLGAAVPQAKAAGDDADFQKRLDHATELSKAKDFSAAVRECDEMLTRWPQHPRLGEVLYRKAQAQTLADDVPGAMATLERLVDRDDRELTEDAYFQIARMERARLRKNGAAYATYGRYLARYPDQQRAVEARMARCEIADYAGHGAEQADECAALLKALPAGHPWIPTAHYHRGVGLHIGRKNAAAGLVEYDAALAGMERTDIYRAGLLYNRAVALMELGRTDEGKAALRAALADYPEHPMRKEIEVLLAR